MQSSFTKNKMLLIIAVFLVILIAIVAFWQADTGQKNDLESPSSDQTKTTMVDDPIAIYNRNATEDHGAIGKSMDNDSNSSTNKTVNSVDNDSGSSANKTVNSVDNDSSSSTDKTVNSTDNKSNSSTRENDQSNKKEADSSTSASPEYVERKSGSSKDSSSNLDNDRFVLMFKEALNGKLNNPQITAQDKDNVRSIMVSYQSGSSTQTALILESTPIFRAYVSIIEQGANFDKLSVDVMGYNNGDTIQWYCVKEWALDYANGKISSTELLIKIRDTMNIG